MRYYLRAQLRLAIHHFNSLSPYGKSLNREGKRHALAGYGADPSGYDAFTSAHPLTAWSWALNGRPLLSTAFTSWTATLR